MYKNVQNLIKINLFGGRMHEFATFGLYTRHIHCRAWTIYFGTSIYFINYYNYNIVQCNKLSCIYRFLFLIDYLTQIRKLITLEVDNIRRGQDRKWTSSSGGQVGIRITYTLFFRYSDGKLSRFH